MEVETVRRGACADAGRSGGVTGAGCAAHARGGSPSACREPPVGPCSPHREEERAPAWAWAVAESCEAVLPSPFPRALGERQPLHKKWWRNHGSEQEHLSLLHGDRGGER